MAHYSAEHSCSISGNNLYLQRRLGKPGVVPNSTRHALDLYQIQLDLARLLCDDGLCKLLNPIIEYVYNPLEYTKDNHIQFLQTYVSSSKKLLFLGMNPGPWGMMQTGIPFGEVHVVREWLKLNGIINSPEQQHPKRPVQGFGCTRSEVSGKRFWTLAKDLSRNNPFQFFKNTFVYNYYPLALLSSTGKNITPSDLKANEQKKIFGPCDATLRRIVEFLEVEVVIAIGRFAEKRAKSSLKIGFPHVKVVFISHPSPRNAASNKDWHQRTIKELAHFDLLKYFV